MLHVFAYVRCIEEPRIILAAVGGHDSCNTVFVRMGTRSSWLGSRLHSDISSALIIESLVGFF